MEKRINPWRAVLVCALLPFYYATVESLLHPQTHSRQHVLVTTSKSFGRRQSLKLPRRFVTSLWVSSSPTRVANSTISDGEGENEKSSKDKKKETLDSKFKFLKDLVKREEVKPVKSDEKEQEKKDSKSIKDNQQDKLKPIETSKGDTRFRRLKDRMWVRETLEDLTAVEFACSVEAADTEKRKRAVDYEKLLVKLDTRIRDMVGQDLNGPFLLKGADEGLKMSDDPVVIEGWGAGKSVYSHQERTDLLKRIITTRKTLLKVMEDREQKVAASNDSRFGLKIPEIRVGILKDEDSSLSPGPKLYVRDDGTVDWEGALQDRAALRAFGSAVWARINGENLPSLDDEEESMSEKSIGSHETAKVTARIEDTPEIVQERAKLNLLQEEFKLKESSHTALLNSAISTGQAVANVRLASLDPTLRNKIRESAESLESIEQKVLFQTLVYELERIYTYLSTEIGNPKLTGYVPLQDRLNVAEFGLLESQIEAFHRELDAEGNIDADILAVVMDQLTDFKRRLGIDYSVTGLTFDREAIGTWLNQLVQKTKSGLGFYVKGCRLFWDDILFCSKLILRALQGYTLKPREVRTLRRTFKDIITFIPVVIILLIPLSPVGHVLVFGAIQRFFPGFFPSCFTEQRQNLLQLYESTEYSEVKINESFQEKLSRIFEAILFSIAEQSQNTYRSLKNQLLGQPENDEDNDDAEDRR